jgi:hypothetical protein
MYAPHPRAFTQATAGAVTEFTLNEMTSMG